MSLCGGLRGVLLIILAGGFMGKLQKNAPHYPAERRANDEKTLSRCLYGAAKCGE
jgi:hypothetical protein